jgi:hypothetical protein
MRECITHHFACDCRERLHADADRIVRALAETSPFYDHNGCAYCGHDCNSEGTDPHAGDCIYARAVRYVEASK